MAKQDTRKRMLTIAEKLSAVSRPTEIQVEKVPRDEKRAFMEQRAKINAGEAGNDLFEHPPSTAAQAREEDLLDPSRFPSKQVAAANSPITVPIGLSTCDLGSRGKTSINTSVH